MTTPKKIFFIAVIFLFTLGTGCTKTALVVSNVDSANTSVVNTNMADIDISDWQTYADEDLGVQFLYPKNYTISVRPITNFSDATEYNPDHFAGQSKVIMMKSTTNELPQINLTANSSDIKNYYGASFHGGYLQSYCEDLQQNESQRSYCTIVTDTNKPILYRNSFQNMECSLTFQTGFGINNPNKDSKFSGLEFATSLVDIKADLFKEPFKDGDICSGNVDIDTKLQKYLQTNFSGDGLTQSDKEVFEILKKIVESVETL